MPSSSMPQDAETESHGRAGLRAYVVGKSGSVTRCSGACTWLTRFLH